METQIPTDIPLLSWRARRRPLHERTHVWYTIATIVTGVLFGYSIATKAWTFAGLIVLTAVAYWFGHRIEDPVDEIAIWVEGFLLDGQFVPWSHCKGFWLNQTREFTELRIDHDKTINRDLIIHTGPVSPLAIRTVFSGFIPELTQRREPVLDIIQRLCKI
ncbi:MAG: hypothetical protein O2904_01185 [bacterium]|nr:hypothetical protein [bacterium]